MSKGEKLTEAEWNAIRDGVLHDGKNQNHPELWKVCKAIQRTEAAMLAKLTAPTQTAVDVEGRLRGIAFDCFAPAYSTNCDDWWDEQGTDFQEAVEGLYRAAYQLGRHSSSLSEADLTEARKLIEALGDIGSAYPTRGEVVDFLRRIAARAVGVPDAEIESSRSQPTREGEE